MCMFYVGVAYMTAVCSSTYGYGVSTGTDGNLEDISASFFWDLFVVAHELGVSIMRTWLIGQCFHVYDNEWFQFI